MNYKDLIDDIKNYDFEFINNEFYQYIFLITNNMFPKLNKFERDSIFNLTCYLVDHISIKFNFKADKSDKSAAEAKKYYDQWTQNNGRDIKSTMLMLFPFIDDKNNNQLFKELSDLNYLLCNIDHTKIDRLYLNQPRDELLKKEFKYGNFSFGLLNSDNKTPLLNLYDDNGDKLIYNIIHHNFIGILETINIVGGKLYVNWMNIQPISSDKNIYQQTDLYNETFKSLNSLDLNNKNPFDKGLYLGDYYNVFRNYYYKDVKKVKWLLFNKRINGKIIYMIQYLNKIFDFDKLFEFEDYEDLSENDMNIFDRKYKELINNVNLNITTISDSTFELEILRNLIAYLINNHTKRNLIKNEFVNEFKLKDPEDDSQTDIEKNQIKIDDISKETIINASRNIDTKYVWNYLKEALVGFQGTIYGKFIISNNKVNDYVNYNDEQLNEIDEGLNLKNIYNIAKSLSHDSNWNLLPENYKSLTDEQKNLFWERLSSDREFTRFVNLRRNLQKQEGPGLDYNSKIRQMGEAFDNNWNDLVWDCLTLNGILSEFKVNLQITDKTKLPLQFKTRQKQIYSLLKKEFKKNKELWENCYYYLTGNKYKDLAKIRVDDPNVNIKEEDYFDLICSEQLWYTFYAMDWISQINFFHHYINHQIIYTTGSTGTGKSTQVPKLLMYALKMYDYKNNGSVICTQPRIPPTVGNAERISTELGVPITQKSWTCDDDKVNTQNYYVQFKHQFKKHTRDNNPHLQLRMVTDGTLLEEVVNNPLMKEQIPKKNKKTGDVENTYGINNKWDIMIVDEAHEHNANMDVILTLARQTCFYNNSVRLVIISATMDDDEPIYRSYFKSINDNIVYPIKRPIKHLFGDKYNNCDDGFLPYSVYMDRRFHISPPGETTQYIITDKFDESIEREFTDDLRKNSIIAQQKSYDVINKICQQSVNGEILLFSTGSAEIRRAVKYLNETLPDGNVALPYFANMNPKYKEMIEKIDKNIHKIKNVRTKIYEEWGPEYIVDQNVPEGLYKRAIIVATNVAEASVTIPRLAYVVDNGYAKVSGYDEIVDISTLGEEKISEASRVQRRGRVGRIGDGTVYYMYGKGQREAVKPKYNITQQDISELFLKLSCSENDLYWDHKYSPYNYKSNELESLINNDKEIKKTPLGKEKIFTSLKHQILLMDEKLEEYYFPEPYFLNYQKGKMTYLDRRIEGYSITETLDFVGQFYLIHPKELRLTRNITNNIIEFDENNRNNIPQSIFANLITKLSSSFQYLNVLAEPLDTDAKINENNYRKTLLSQWILDLRRDTNNIIEGNDIFTLIVGKGYNIYNEVIEILSMMKTLENGISTLAIPKDSGKPDFNALYNRFGNQKSDFVGLYKIIKLLKDNFPDMKLFNLIEENSSIILDIKDKYSRLVKSFRKIKFTLDPPKKYSCELWNLLNSLKQSGKLKPDEGYMFFLEDEVEKIVKREIIMNRRKLENFCELNSLNFETIYMFMISYMKLCIAIITAKKEYDTSLEEKSSLEKIEELSSSFKKSLINPTLEEKIIRSFLIANSYNVGFKLDHHDENYRLVRGIRSEPKTVTRYTNQVNTLCSELNSTICYSRVDRSGDIHMISKISPDILATSTPIFYNPDNFKHFYLRKNYNKENNKEEYELKHLYGKLFENVIYNIRNNFSLIYVCWDHEDLVHIREYLNSLKKKLIKYM